MPTKIIKETETAPVILPPVYKENNNPNNAWAILVGAVIISIAILIHGGYIRIKGFSSTSTAKVTPTVTNTVETGTTGDPTANVINLAGQIGFNADQIASCISDGKYKDEITKDIADASSAGASATPSFLVGTSTSNGTITGHKIIGAHPYSTFKAAIDALINGQAVPTIAGSDPADSGTAQVSVDDDPVLGSANAPVTLIEFSDYECPFCKRHYSETYPQLKKDYIDTGKVKLVFRDLPLSFHDPVATIEAEAANCAREQGGDEAYWKMHDAIFTNTKSNGEGV